MSIRAENVTVENPARFSKDWGLGFYIEAPPHITGLRIKMVLSGTRSETSGTITRAETLGYNKEETYARVPILRDSSALGFSPSSDPLYGYDLQGSPMSYAPVDPTECRILQPTWGTGDFFQSPQMARSPVDLFFAREFAPEVCGTWSYGDTSDPSADDGGDITISAWPLLDFLHDPSADKYREPADRWGALHGAFVLPFHGPFGSYPSADLPSVDISGWDILQWRAKTGFLNTYTLTETTYRSGGTTSAAATIEWELLTT